MTSRKRSTERLNAFSGTVWRWEEVVRCHTVRRQSCTRIWLCCIQTCISSLNCSRPRSSQLEPGTSRELPTALLLSGDMTGMPVLGLRSRCPRVESLIAEARLHDFLHARRFSDLAFILPRETLPA